MEARKHITVWYDKEADFLEVMFEKREGYFRETADDAVMEKIDTQGTVIGFSILNVSEMEKGRNVSVTLESNVA